MVYYCILILHLQTKANRQITEITEWPHVGLFFDGQLLGCLGTPKKRSQVT